MSPNFVPKGPTNDIPALVQIMDWCRPGDKPLSEAIMVSLLRHTCATRPQWGKSSEFQYTTNDNQQEKEALIYWFLLTFKLIKWDTNETVIWFWLIINADHEYNHLEMVGLDQKSPSENFSEYWKNSSGINSRKVKVIKYPCQSENKTIHDQTSRRPKKERS